MLCRLQSALVHASGPLFVHFVKPLGWSGDVFRVEQVGTGGGVACV